VENPAHLQKMQEIQDKHNQLVKQRQLDEKLIEERRAKSQQAREQRLQDALEALYSNNMLGSQASRILEEHEMKEEMRRQELYRKWDGEVCRRVEYHVGKFMNAVTQPPPPGMDRCKLLASDDPLKVAVRELQAEENFHRAATAVLSAPIETPSLDASMQHVKLAKKSAMKNGRPMLAVETWHQARPHMLHSDDGGSRTSRKISSEHYRAALDESDGVMVAGKTRNRYEKNLLGILQHDPRSGEAAQHKTLGGASSAAPNQDHYTFATGIGVVDNELPLGKRCFPQASGLALS
jgi:hypothetical protein